MSAEMPQNGRSEGRSSGAGDFFLTPGVPAWQASELSAQVFVTGKSLFHDGYKAPDYGARSEELTFGYSVKEPLTFDGAVQPVAMYDPATQMSNYPAAFGGGTVRKEYKVIPTQVERPTGVDSMGVILDEVEEDDIYADYYVD